MNEMDRIEMTSYYGGASSMEVCAVADATNEGILEFCDRENPAYTGRGWVMVVREGEGAPVTCGVHAGRVHFLVRC